MGPPRLKACVADAGPLIHLAEIGASSLLGICTEVVVPRAVWGETVGRGRVSEADVVSHASVSDVPASGLEQVVEKHTLQSLQSGENEALFLCDSLRIGILLTDDLAARDAAKRLGVTPVGSLGVVVRAYRVGDVTCEQAKALIADLQTCEHAVRHWSHRRLDPGGAASAAALRSGCHGARRKPPRRSS